MDLVIPFPSIAYLLQEFGDNASATVAQVRALLDLYRLGLETVDQLAAIEATAHRIAAATDDQLLELKKMDFLPQDWYVEFLETQNTLLRTIGNSAGSTRQRRALDIADSRDNVIAPPCPD